MYKELPYITLDKYRKNSSLVLPAFRNEYERWSDLEYDIAYSVKALNSVSQGKNMGTIWNGLKVHLNDINFQKKLNLQKHLLLILNKKVIDLMTGEILDRKKKHNFSIECPVEYGIGETAKETVEKILREIFWVPTHVDGEKIYECSCSEECKCGAYEKKKEEYYQCIIMILGYLITGESCEKLMFLLLGEGNNGKSILTSFLEEICGDLLKIDTGKLLSQKRGGPNPEFLSMRNGRVILIQEPSKTDKLDMTTIKQVTGGDKFSARELYSNTVEKFPLDSNKPVITLNKICDLDLNDPASFARILLIYFYSKFVDINDDSKIKNMIETLITYLLILNFDIF